jgi:hypothetical protein
VRGVIVAADSQQEWLLPWWWKRYSAHNSYPVAFFDFGMSKESKLWCQERGAYYPLEVADLKEVESERTDVWQKRWGEGIWLFRRAWFKKPLACLLAPFDVNCWCDLDCEVRGNLEPLFESLTPDMAIALAREDKRAQEMDLKQGFSFEGEISYNSGVLVFRKDEPLIHAWEKSSREQNDRFLSDQTLLSRLIYLTDAKVKELSPIWNWLRNWGENPEALVVHYNQSAKLEILKKQL